MTFNLGLAFDHNRVVEQLGFSSDGSSGEFVGLQAEARLSQGGQVHCGAASGFERQRLLIALGFSCVQ